MTWEEFINRKHHSNAEKDTVLYIKTNIECPQCKRYLIRDNKILLSMPPQHHYLCDCGWEGYN